MKNLLEYDDPTNQLRFTATAVSLLASVFCEVSKVHAAATAETTHRVPATPPSLPIAPPSMPVAPGRQRQQQGSCGGFSYFLVSPSSDGSLPWPSPVPSPLRRPSAPPYRCTICGDEVNGAGPALARVPGGFDWWATYSSGVSSAARAACKIRIHSEFKGHRPPWNFARTDNFFTIRLEENRQSPNEIAADWLLVKSVPPKKAREQFQTLITKSDLAPPDLLGLVRSRMEAAYNMLFATDGRHVARMREAFKEAFKKLGNQGLQPPPIDRNAIWDVACWHARSVERGIETNWDEISKMDPVCLFGLLQDVFHGNHYGRSAVYLPSESTGTPGRQVDATTPLKVELPESMMLL